MPFSMSCPHKGCRKSQDPYIDPKTDKVFCSICDKEIPNVNYFTKVQMKNLKQYKPKVTLSYAVKCNKCGHEDRPKMTKNDLLCSRCLKSLDHLSMPFKTMLRTQLDKLGTQEDD